MKHSIQINSGITSTFETLKNNKRSTLLSNAIFVGPGDQMIIAASMTGSRHHMSEK